MRFNPETSALCESCNSERWKREGDVEGDRDYRVTRNLEDMCREEIIPFQSARNTHCGSEQLRFSTCTFADRFYERYKDTRP